MANITSIILSSFLEEPFGRISHGKVNAGAVSVASPVVGKSANALQEAATERNLFAQTAKPATDGSSTIEVGSSNPGSHLEMAETASPSAEILPVTEDRGARGARVAGTLGGRAPAGVPAAANERSAVKTAGSPTLRGWAGGRGNVTVAASGSPGSGQGSPAAVANSSSPSVIVQPGGRAPQPGGRGVKGANNYVVPRGGRAAGRTDAGGAGRASGRGTLLYCKPQQRDDILADMCLKGIITLIVHWKLRQVPQ